MADRYWVGGTGTWDTTSTTHWSTTSGGSAGASAPTATDAVILDNNSGTGTITTSGALACASLTATFYGGGLTLAAGLTVNGGISLGGGMTFTPAGNAVTLTPSANCSVSSSGGPFAGLTIAATGGAVVTANGLTCTGTLTLTSGGLSGADVTAANFSSSNSNTRSLTLGGTQWMLTGTGTVWDLATTTGLTFTKGTTNILLSNTTTAARTFAGGGLTYNKLTIVGVTGTSNLTITGSNTFSELASTKIVAHTITFTAGTTTTIGKWSISGTAGNLVTLTSDSTSAATLSYSGTGFIRADYMNISYITANPDLTWFMGANSTNSGNNTRVYFLVPPLGSSLFFGSNF